MGSVNEDMEELRKALGNFYQELIDSAPKWVGRSLEGWRLVYRRWFGS